MEAVLVLMRSRSLSVLVVFVVCTLLVDTVHARYYTYHDDGGRREGIGQAEKRGGAGMFRKKNSYMELLKLLYRLSPPTPPPGLTDSMAATTFFHVYGKRAALPGRMLDGEKLDLDHFAEDQREDMKHHTTSSALLEMLDKIVHELQRQ